MKSNEKSKYKIKHPTPKNPPEGYVKVKGRYSKGQAIYYSSKYKNYLTPDIDQHKGGYWKKAKEIEYLLSKSKRLGTFDEDGCTKIDD